MKVTRIVEPRGRGHSSNGTHERQSSVLAVTISVDAPVEYERECEREMLALLLRVLNGGRGQHLLVWLRQESEYLDKLKREV